MVFSQIIQHSIQIQNRIFFRFSQKFTQNLFLLTPAKSLLISSRNTWNMTALKKALVIITNGSEEIESVTPIDVLRRAGVEVVVAGLINSDPVTCSRNVVLVPEASLSSIDPCTSFDAVILPGGLKGAQAFANSEIVGKLIRKQEEDGKFICAICAAPIALKSHNICNGKKLTSHPSVKEKMIENSNYEYEEDRVVVDGKLITSRGPGTALEFSLAIVESLCGKDKANEVATPMIQN